MDEEDENNLDKNEIQFVEHSGGVYNFVMIYNTSYSRLVCWVDSLISQYLIDSIHVACQVRMS